MLRGLGCSPIKADINFRRAVYGTLYAIPHLKINKGRIIVIASAVINFFETLRMELGWAIGITIATPGWIKTDLTLRAMEYEDINFWGSAYGTYFSMPHLRKSKGKIVAVASCTGWLPVPMTIIYSASKAAVISLYENLTTELGTDIGITIVTPGLIESEISQGKVLSKEGRMVVDQQMRDLG
ncbi:11-beta-hydroxysteroid dehydrogenase 6 [Spatholobus suberectus]|nr:11-beta-hydroxysteroid dehydrogenase 6 [Spatholobus suberectus]